MNNIDDMFSNCYGCSYWEVCEPPYICGVTIPEKYKNKNKKSNKTNIDYTDKFEKQESK